MIDELISYLQNSLSEAFGSPLIVCLILASLPIVEARLAIPMAFSYGYGGLTPFIIGFLGSTLVVPILLVALLPLLRALRKIPLIGKMSSGILDRVQNNSDEISQKKPSVKAKSFAVFAFVALPLPLTGVWTGCALSSLLSIGYARSITAIIAGNLISSLIVYILCCFFPTPVINCIITAIGVVALCSIIALFIKVVVKKS